MSAHRKVAAQQPFPADLLRFASQAAEPER